MEQVAAGPVEDGHEVVADDLHTKPGQIADGLLIVLNIHIPGGQTNLDIVVDIDRLHHVDVEAVFPALSLDFGNLSLFPDLSGHLVVQCPDDAGHAGDLPDVGKFDVVIVLAVPAKTHLHSKTPPFDEVVY